MVQNTEKNTFLYLSEAGMPGSTCVSLGKVCSQAGNTGSLVACITFGLCCQLSLKPVRTHKNTRLSPQQRGQLRYWQGTQLPSPVSGFLYWITHSSLRQAEQCYRLLLHRCQAFLTSGCAASVGPALSFVLKDGYRKCWCWGVNQS